MVENVNGMVMGSFKIVSVDWRDSMGKTYAFVTVEDLGDGGGFSPKVFLKYWGEADFENQAATIKEVLNWGGKWEVATC